MLKITPPWFYQIPIGLAEHAKNARPQPLFSLGMSQDCICREQSRGREQCVPPGRRAGTLIGHCKAVRFPGFRFLSCMCRCTSRTTCIIPIGPGAQGIDTNVPKLLAADFAIIPFFFFLISDLGISYLLSASMKLWQAHLLVSKGKISDP